ncbi:Fic/DOC family protein [uncultured archaeon]|nr:Fic/DOC family protein [uncultured archaeon]
MKYISEPLRNELRTRYYALHDKYNVDSIIKCRNIRMKSIVENARINSYRIEHPHEGVPFSIPRNKHKKMIKTGINNLKNSFEWGIKNFNPAFFDEFFIRELSGRILPTISQGGKAPFRDIGVTISGATTTPPYPYKVINYEIPQFVSSLKEQLSNEGIINQIEAAIFAHLHIARIHPFVDGNGRTARTLQDVILDHYNVPLPLIEAGERLTYYSLLDEAVADYKEKKSTNERFSGASKGEKLFYDFIAGKINVSLDKVLHNQYHG